MTEKGEFTTYTERCRIITRKCTKNSKNLSFFGTGVEINVFKVRIRFYLLTCTGRYTLVCSPRRPQLGHGEDAGRRVDLAGLPALLVGPLGGGPHLFPVGSVEPLEAGQRICVLDH